MPIQIKPVQITPVQLAGTISIKASLLAATAAFFIASAPVHACGESLYRVGKGVTYREYTAPLPGAILVVAPDEDSRMLALALAKAGHNVQTVADIDALRGKIERGEYDIVMSRFEHHGEVDVQVANTGVDYLPVARHDSEEIALAKAQYERSFTTADNIKTYLRKIHRALKVRKS